MTGIMLKLQQSWIFSLYCLPICKYLFRNYYIHLLYDVQIRETNTTLFRSTKTCKINHLCVCDVHITYDINSLTAHKKATTNGIGISGPVVLSLWWCVLLPETACLFVLYVSLWLDDNNQM